MNRSRKHLFQVALVVLVQMAIVGCSGVSQGARELVGKPAPAVRLTLLDGSAIPLDAELGKVTAVLFWATWCGHSRGVIADFEEFAKQYHKRSDVSFIAVSVDRTEDMEILQSRIASQDLRYLTHAFSGNETQDEAFLGFKGDSVPYIAIIDARGIVRSVSNSTSELEEYLEARFK